MIKIKIDDFIEEVKCELFGYLEIEEEKIVSWEEKFRNKLKKLNSIKIKDDEFILKDENDLFEVADGFYSAVINGEEDKYWEML